MLRVIGNDESLPRQEHVTASGALTKGSAVVANSDGTASLPFNTKKVFNEGTSTTTAIATNGSGTFVVMYVGPASSYTGKIFAGTISGSTITFGTAIDFATEAGLGEHSQTVVYDPDNDKFVIIYPDYGNSGYLTSRVVTVSGTSVSLGTAVVMDSQNVTSNSADYDTSADKIVCAWRGGTSTLLAAAVGTVSGTSISWGSTANSVASKRPAYLSVVYDSNADKTAVFYRDDADTHDGYYVVLTVSGTSVSGGSTATFHAADTNYISATYDSTAQKIVIIYQDAGNSSRGTAIVGTISGTSMTFGSEAVFSGTDGVDSIKARYDSGNNKTFIFFDRSSGLRGLVGTVSGTSITFGSESTLSTGNITYTDLAFDTGQGKALCTFTNNASSSHGTFVAVDTTFSTTNFTSENFIGISRNGVASGKGAFIDTQGTITNSLTGLTAGQSYFVQTDGTLGTTAADPSVFAGTAVSATELIVKG